MVRSSFSILFATRESKARKSGKAPIEITITVNGERCTLSTGKQVPIEKWDKTRQQVKGKDEEAQSLNNYLKAIKAKLYQKEAELLDRGFIITAELLRDAYFDKVESLKEKSLFEVFEEHNQEQKVYHNHHSYIYSLVSGRLAHLQYCNTSTIKITDPLVELNMR